MISDLLRGLSFRVKLIIDLIMADNRSLRHVIDTGGHSRSPYRPFNPEPCHLISRITGCSVPVKRLIGRLATDHIVKIGLYIILMGPGGWRL